MSKQTKVQICKECEIGRVLPKYSRGSKPTYRCNHCKVVYVPIAERSWIVIEDEV